MSRDPVEEDPEQPADGRRDGPPPEGRLRTTRPGPLLGCLLAGLVVGWLVRPVAVALDTTAPRVTWPPAVALALAAAILLAVAVGTRRTVLQRRPGLRAHQAVNRLVLAKACAISGALVAGGYLGYALTWVGIAAELSGERTVRSLAAAAAALATVGGALLLERACRVTDDDETGLGR
ncbi:MAG TPA: DUF3180 domain-containing protein [Marmoricola sp.]|nr:DUF3180 domain-containing protein [Marmoricola sp.]